MGDDGSTCFATDVFSRYEVSVIELGNGVAVFSALNRFGSSNNITDSDYFYGLVKVGIPWYIVGVVLSVLFLLWVLLTTFLVKVDEKVRSMYNSLEFPIRGFLAGIWAILGIGAVASAGVATVASTITYEVTSRVGQNLVSLLDTVSGVLTFSSSVLLFAIEAATDVLDSRRDSLPENALDSVEQADQVFKEVSSALVGATDAVNSMTNEVTSATTTIVDSVKLIVALTILAIIIASLLPMFSLLASSRKSQKLFSKLAKVFWTVLLIIPLLFAWVGIGLSAGVGAGVSDVCLLARNTAQNILDEAQGETPSLPADPSGLPEFLVSLSLTCPADLPNVPPDLQAAFDKLNGEIIPQTVEVIQAETATDLQPAIDCVKKVANDLIFNCTFSAGVIVDTVNDLCGDDGSLMESVYNLYICLTIMAIFYTFLHLCNVLGLEVYDYVQVYDMISEMHPPVLRISEYLHDDISDDLKKKDAPFPSPEEDAPDNDTSSPTAPTNNQWPLTENNENTLREDPSVDPAYYSTHDTHPPSTTT